MERDMERDTELAYLLQPPIEVVLERLSPYPLPLRLFAVKESVVVLPPPRDLTGFRLFINSFPSPKPGSLDFEVEIQPRYYRNGKRVLASCTPNLAERRLPQSPLLPLHPSLEEMKLLMWNVRGAGSSAFRDHLLQHINTHKPGIVLVVETRLSGSRAVEVCESLPFTNFRIQDANTFKGGLWLLWNGAEVNVEPISSNFQVIHANIKVSPNTSPWLLSCIYASPKLEERLLLWEHLKNLSSLNNLPWMCIGDFNELLSQQDKLGGNPIIRSRASAFCSMLEACNLLDMGFVGPRFTWVCKKNNSFIYERLDRAFCDPLWRNLFPEASIQHLARTRSDHCPLIVNLYPQPPDLSIKPFHLEKF